MIQIEQTLTTIEVAEMVEKDHNMLLRDIRRYSGQLGQSNIAQSGFFTESTYRNRQNKEMPCYNVTKKGCEFIAHKLTGIKGTIFTARYINRFHEMQEILTERTREPELPWFIRKFRGRYVVLEHDFIAITGVNIKEHKFFYRMEYFTRGRDWNGWGWKCENDKFRAEYGFDYGTDSCMRYFYPCGVIKALRILENDSKVSISSEAYELLSEGIKAISKISNKVIEEKRSEKISKADSLGKKFPIQINIVVDNESKVLC